MDTARAAGPALFIYSGMVAVLLGLCVAAPANGNSVSVMPEEMHRLKFTGFWIPFDSKISSELTAANIQNDLAEELKKNGFNMAEGDGKSSEEGPRFKLGAMAKALNCVGRSEKSCEIEIMWELWDGQCSSVVYRVRTRATELNIDENNRIPGLKNLVKKALQSLMSRPRFVDELKKSALDNEGKNGEKGNFDDAAFLACDGAALRMPEDVRSVMAATTLIRSGQSVGSGVSISPDGFVLTAAHVVEASTAKIVFQDGKEYEGVLIRKNRKRDVALLKMKGTGYPCLNFRKGQGRIGEKIYAIGAPAGEEFAFSLTTGIISAERKWENHTFLQTDASINPGNSGGPLLDEQGNILATVSWKLVGIGVEGIGFGIPIETAFESLSIAPGSESSPVLSHENPLKNSEGESRESSLEDTPDEKQQLIPHDGRRARKNVQWKRPFQKITRWTGVGLFSVGAALTTVSYTRVKIASGQPEDDYNLMTYGQYKAWIGTNVAGWVSASLGAALFITSFLVRPDDKWSTQARLQVRGGVFGNAATLEVRF